MAVDPKARIVTFAYEGGTFTATRGLIEEMLGPIKLKWTPPVSFIDSLTGRKRFKYGRRQRSLASGGRVIYIRLDSDEVFSGRISGEDNVFIDQVLTKTEAGKILEIWTERGTIYAPQFVEDVPIVPTDNPA